MAMLALMAGCADLGDAEYLALETPPWPLVPRDPMEIDLFVSSPIARPHVDVGLLQVASSMNGDSLHEAMVLLRNAAAAHGCDAVLMTKMDARYTDESPQTAQGVCVVYTDLASPVLPAPPSAVEVQPAAPEQLHAALATGGRPVAVRSAPSRVAPVIVRLPSGTPVTALSTNPGWVFVKLSDGRGGYVLNNSILFR